MKKLQSNFTTPEQSMRLLELGVPADSADMCYKINYEVARFDKIPTAIPYKDFTAKILYCPCWSVGRLIEIYSIITGRKEFTLRTVDTLINEVIYMLNVAIKHEEFDFSKLEE